MTLHFSAPPKTDDARRPPALPDLLAPIFLARDSVEALRRQAERHAAQLRTRAERANAEAEARAYRQACDIVAQAVRIVMKGAGS